MKNHALTYTIGFVVIGVIITLLIFYVQRTTYNTNRENLPYVSLGDNIKSKTASANLLLERLMAGDNDLKLEEDVLPVYDSAHDLLQAAYDGNDSELGKFAKISDEETRAAIKEAAIGVDRLAEAARGRWSARPQPIIVAETDSITADVASLPPVENVKSDAHLKFDAVNNKLQASIHILTSRIIDKVGKDATFLNAISFFSIGIILACFIVLSVVLYKFQNQYDKSSADSAQKLTRQAGAVNKLSDFIEAVSAGNYAVDLNLEGDEDLTKKLITMRDKLKENTESDRRRSWATTGLAQIGEILRMKATNTTELYDNIMRFLVKYTNSNQGGLFIINEEAENENDTFLELVACYAFERKKFLTKKVGPGEGLVGQCFLEGERIYLNTLPDNYISISSGLGSSRPRAILIVPMKLNGKIYGIIELATFNAYQDYEIELIEKLAENIASTVSAVRTNESTRVLLETTQQQSEEMKAQEEEIRQNMEELEATQEELQRKQKLIEQELKQSQEQTEILKIQEKKLVESQDTLQAIVDNIPRAIFWKDKSLNFMGCNKIFSNVAGLASTKDVIGKSDFDMAWSAHADLYRKDDLEVINSRKAKLDIEEVNVSSDGQKSWVLTSKVPIINVRNEVVAILGMFEDITARKLRDADLADKLQERERALVEIQELKQLLQAQR